MGSAPERSPTPLGPGAEFDMIRDFLAGGDAARPGPLVRVGPGDDCAVVTGDGIAVSTDLFVEGVHFRRDWLEHREIGYRAAAASLSDLAAVAARPIGVLVSLMLPDDDDAAFAGEEVMAGVRSAAAAAEAALLGGDLSASPGPLALDVVAVGEAPAPKRRRGARPGDEIWVTGELGAAAAAVRAWEAGGTPPPAARQAFAQPRPRIAEARWLADRGAVRALIDLSDGLAGDASHLAAASGVAIVLEPERVPVHPAAREVAGGGDAALELAMAGGEDYELCLASPPGVMDGLASAFEAVFGLEVHRVGRVEPGSGIHVRRPDGGRQPIRRLGYRHFEGGD